jgi:hypothetical protein
MRDGMKVSKGSKVIDLDALAKKGKRFFAFSRSAFGMVKIRTDGDRLLVYTDSGNVKLKEAYAYEIACGQPRAVNVIQACKSAVRRFARKRLLARPAMLLLGCSPRWRIQAGPPAPRSNSKPGESSLRKEPAQITSCLSIAQLPPILWLTESRLHNIL